MTLESLQGSNPQDRLHLTFYIPKSKIRILLFPSPWNRRVAELASSIYHIHLKNIEVRSMDNPFVARRAECGIMNMPRHIPDVNIFQTISLCNLVGRFQGWDWGRGEMGQFIIGGKPGKMERRIYPQILFDPSAHFADHFWVVI